jgi:RNA polymerase sigma-70 factor (ECF subfamily)
MKQFYNNYSGYLTTVCSRYITNRDDIKDVLQDSFIKIFKAIANFEYKGLGSLRAWATRIVVNESLKFLKENEKLNIISSPTWDLPEIIEEEESDFDEVPISTILEMIRSLPVGYRTVFNLYIFEKKSHKEIASILNITESTSASQLHRAKSFLAKQINIYRLTKRMEL